MTWTPESATSEIAVQTAAHAAKMSAARLDRLAHYCFWFAPIGSAFATVAALIEHARPAEGAILGLYVPALAASVVLALIGLFARRRRDRAAERLSALSPVTPGEMGQAMELALRLDRADIVERLQTTLNHRALLKADVAWLRQLESQR